MTFRALFLGLVSAAALAGELRAQADAGIAWGSRLLEVASGGAQAEAWRQNETQLDYVDDATVVLSAGHTMVAWVDQRAKDVMVRIFGADGAALTAPVNVSQTPEIFSWLPRLAVGAQSNVVHVLWQEIVFSGGSHGGDIFHARSTDGGRTFASPRNLSRSREGDGKGRLNARIWHNGSFDLIAGDGGRVLAAWTDYEGSLWISRSHDDGESFSPPARVAGTRELPARGPSLAFANAENVLLAWTVGEDPDADIRVARSRDGGASFASPVVLSVGPGRADAPKIAAQAGLVHLAYALQAPAADGGSAVFYAQSTDGGATFGESVPLSRPLPTQTDGAGYPHLAVAAGRVVVAWELFPTGAAQPRGLGYSVSPDNGRTFAPPQVVPGSADPAGFNGSRQGLLMDKVAAGADGNVAITNSSYLAGRGSRVWVMRGRFSAPVSSRQ